MSTLFRKGLSQDAKKSGVSSFQAKKIRRALKFIQSTPTQQLLKSSNIVKINVPGRDDIYLYRVDLQQRIVLSINKEEKIIHSIVNGSDMKTNTKD